MTNQSQLDRNLATLSAREPWFAPTFAAARRLLDGAKAVNDELVWPACVCGPQGCSCGNRGCLHAPARRVWRGE